MWLLLTDTISDRMDAIFGSRSLKLVLVRLIFSDSRHQVYYKGLQVSLESDLSWLLYRIKFSSDYASVLTKDQSTATFSYSTGFGVDVIR